MASLQIDLKKIERNYRLLKKIAEKYQIQFLPVTKCLLSHEKLIEVLVEAGCEEISEAHFFNLLNWKKKIPVKKNLLSISPSIIKSSLTIIDSVIVSDIFVIEKINNLGLKNKIGIILPIEIGELRDGIFLEELENFLTFTSHLKNIQIQGFDLNYGCIRGVIPDMQAVEETFQKAKAVSEKLGIIPNVFSVGGTIFYDSFKNGEIKGLSNQIRMGEAFIFGYNTYTAQNIEEMEQGAVILKGEILELRNKNIEIKVKTGWNSYGNKSEEYPEKGIRKLAVLDFGYLDDIKKQLIPLDNGIKIFGNSHNHTVVDLTDSKEHYKTGGEIQFYTCYDITEYGMLVPYIKKVFI
ncbi:MAG: hypothetical protein A2Y41_02930 [Spirochaetes bacterium GWB1_36_13]|nr:MAG: hypothetical protein A2Y41_02930 [Spirochaetes bacterium GWB1_36_13]